MSSTAQATCINSNDWSFNSKDQSPCTVATELARVCVPEFRLPPLDDGYFYTGPSASVANPCRCNSVYYAMLSACADCQEREFVRWSRYSFNCTEVYVELYPYAIPDNTAVPGWAFIDYTVGDNFNATRAQADDSPERTGTDSGGQQAPAKKTNVGAIAGGVIGGVVFLALVGLLAFFLVRRRKQKQVAPSTVYNQSTGAEVSMYSNNLTTTGGYGDQSNYVPSTIAPRIYDPNDPSTWPTHQDALRTGTPPPSAGYTYNNAAPYAPVPQAHTGQSGSFPSNPSYPHVQNQQPMPMAQQPPAGRYTGVPEL